MANKRPTLQAEKRTILGKNVKKLRREGFTPGNIYGRGIPSVSIQVNSTEFAQLYKEVGGTGLVDISLDGEVRPILIQNVHRNPLTRVFLHADMFQVNLKEKIKAMIPVVTVGEPAAVAEKVGLLLQPLSEVEVEALPADLPEKLEVNVEALAAIDDQVTVADITAPKDVTILTDVEQVVAKIAELVTEEAQEQAEADAAAAEEAKAEGEGEAPAEGEAPEGEKSEATEEKAEATE